MSADLVTTSLTIHGAVCAAAVLAIWKLGGESKFGTEKVADLHNLRPKLLKSVVASLELCLNPVLAASGVTEAVDVDAAGNPKPVPARLAITGKEALTNAVRDFVKGDWQGLLDLRSAQMLNARLNASLDWLRITVWALFVSSGITCLLMVAGKCEWLTVTAVWIHAISYAALVLLLLFVALLFFWILDASSLVDRLKSAYADLS